LCARWCAASIDRHHPQPLRIGDSPRGRRRTASRACLMKSSEPRKVGIGASTAHRGSANGRRRAEDSSAPLLNPVLSVGIPPRALDGASPLLLNLVLLVGIPPRALNGVSPPLLDPVLRAASSHLWDPVPSSVRTIGRQPDAEESPPSQHAHHLRYILFLYI
jgi:hypothetical protein